MKLTTAFLALYSAAALAGCMAHDGQGHQGVQDRRIPWAQRLESFRPTWTQIGPRRVRLTFNNATAFDVCIPRSAIAESGPLSLNILDITGPAGPAVAQLDDREPRPAGLRALASGRRQEFHL